MLLPRPSHPAQTVHQFGQLQSSVSSSSLRATILTHELQLIWAERQNSADVVRDGQREQRDEEQEQQNPPETEILHKLLPRGAKAGEDAVAAVEVRVQERMTLHGTGQEEHRDVS